MVYSNLNTSIFYKETPELNPNDKGHASVQYNLELFGIEITIILGKINTIYADKNIVFYPIYILRGSGKKQTQIGVYEVESNKSLEILDEDGDVDTEKTADPLLYGFVDEDFIKRIKTEQRSPSSIVAKSEETSTEKVKEETEEDRVIKVKIPHSKKSEQLELADQELDAGIFELDPSVKPPDSLEEETAEEAKAIKGEYKESSKSPWIAKFMKNNHFGIHEVEANGDCFFATIRDAFKQIGKITTVKKLRAILAGEITDDMLQERRTVYLALKSDVDSIEKDMADIKKNLNKVYAPRIAEAKASQDKPTLTKLQAEQANEKKRYAQLQSEKNSTSELIQEVIGDFAHIDTLEKFRAFVQTPAFWADTWSIGVLERKLNIKMIILSHRSYQEGALDNVMECGEIDKKTQEKGSFSPSHYIMVSFSGNHFKLITYKNKRILKFHEIPFYIKNLILNKCLEKSAGPFYVISDFKDIMKTKLGKESEESDKEPDLLNGHLYNHRSQLVFGIKVSKSAKPGNMSGEHIPKEDMKLYLPLQKNKEWRRKLDDEYEAQFNLDGHKWLTVEHYYQGAKFSHGFPDYSLQFSLDSESDISKSADLATEAGSINGKKKGVLLRPKNVVVDPTFYGDRSAKTRENALYAKFSQNEDLKQMLLATRDAKLSHFVRGDEPERDDMLMTIRSRLALEPVK